MRQKFRIFLYILLLGSVGFFSYMAGKWGYRYSLKGCTELSPLLKDLMKNRKMGLLSTYIANDGEVYMTLVNDLSHEWIQLRIIRGAKYGCTAMEGRHWQYMGPGAIKLNVEPKVPDDLTRTKRPE